MIINLSCELPIMAVKLTDDTHWCYELFRKIGSIGWKTKNGFSMKIPKPPHWAHANLSRRVGFCQWFQNGSKITWTMRISLKTVLILDGRCFLENPHFLFLVEEALHPQKRWCLGSNTSTFCFLIKHIISQHLTSRDIFFNSTPRSKISI